LGAGCSGTITGNIAPGTNGGNCVSFAGQGLLTVNGNVNGGNGVVASSYGIQQSTIGSTLIINGNVTGGSTLSTCYGINCSVSNYIYVYGTVTASDNCAAINTNTALLGMAFFQIIQGNNYPTSGTAVYPFILSGTTPACTVDAIICGSAGWWPITTSGTNRVFMRDAGTNYIQMRQSTGGATTTLGEISNDYPSEVNVRYGTTYNFGARIGTMKVPLANTVTLNVPVDNTVGTAALTPESLLGANTIARLQICSTVPSVGEQLAALGS
jgi:hypothetical protein